MTDAHRRAAADFADWHEGFKEENEVAQLAKAMELHAEASIAPYVEALRRLTNAVKALPVEDMIESDQHGEFELVGYCMQAQGEWDAVTQELAQIDALLENG